MSATLIDNIYTNVLNKDISSGLFITDISDHLPAFQVTHNMTCQHRNNHNLCSFKMKVSSTSWNNILASDSDTSYQNFLNHFKSLYNECFPLRKTNPRKSLDKPWMTNGLKNCCRKKNNFYKKFLHHKTIETENRYKQYKNKLVSVLRIAERNYYSSKLLELKGDIKNTWKVLKNVINRKGLNKKPNTTFKYNNEIIEDPKIISSKFNKFFVNIGSSLASKIPKVDTDMLQFMQGEFVNSMYLDSVSKEEVLKIIHKEKSNKASGWDDIDINVVKVVAEEIVSPLTEIFNQSFRQGSVPRDLKISKVIPIFKSGENDQFSNYRPVSILPVFSKLIEKLFYKRLLNYINSNNILYHGQYGFREKSSTTLALIDLIEDISTAIENNEYTVGVFIDLKKAFDTIDHNLLLRKLHFYGVRGIVFTWLESYLQDRQQYVYYNSISSSSLPISCGVPQGSILGPLLFILYINDISNVSRMLKFILFADDTNIFFLTII